MFANLSTGSIGVSATLEEIIQLAAAIGYGGVDINLDEAEEFGLGRTKGLLRENNLKLGGWGLPVEFRQDEDTFKDTLAELPQKASIAHELGLTRCNTWVPSGSNERTYQEQFDLLANRFCHCAEILWDHGCYLGLEFLGPKTILAGFKHEGISNMADMLKLCSAAGTGNLGLLLDCWHWYTSGGTIAEIEALDPQQVVYVHVNDAPVGIPIEEHIDNERALPMETGVIDLPAFLKALNKIGYDGPITAEPLVPGLADMEPQVACQTIADCLKKGWDAAGLEW
ncbi:MAG: sugar phosphate isomerase/epimerase family protein [Candidatus Latescibacteria bacterium]|jgi:sugar phosphate isomerase/epimerase|nr:sugar phosphate isomerase/epimerase family protein [Candidatus Latescibacterota bacterium]